MGLWHRINNLDKRLLRVRYVPKDVADRRAFLQNLAEVNGQLSLGYAEPTRAAITELAAEVVALRQQVDQLLADRHRG